MHFSEVIKGQFGKKSYTLLYILSKSKQQPWTIILLVYVGSIVDLIGLTNTNKKRGRDRYNVELRFKGYYISNVTQLERLVKLI